VNECDGRRELIRRKRGKREKKYATHSRLTHSNSHHLHSSNFFFTGGGGGGGGGGGAFTRDTSPWLRSFFCGTRNRREGGEEGRLVSHSIQREGGGRKREGKKISAGCIFAAIEARIPKAKEGGEGKGESR